MARPVVATGFEEDDPVFYAPGLVHDGFANLVVGAHGGGFDVEYFTGSRLKAWIGAINNKRGNDFKWHVSNFIEKQRATICQRKAADVRIDGTGERTPLMTEQLAFKKTGGHRRTVHFDEIPAATRAELVDCARDNLFAGSCLAGDQDSGVRSCDGFDIAEDGTQTAAASHDRLKERVLSAFWFAHNGRIKAGGSVAPSWDFPRSVNVSNKI